MAQVSEIKFGQKVMEKETEKKISEIEGMYEDFGLKDLNSFYFFKWVKMLRPVASGQTWLLLLCMLS